MRVYLCVPGLAWLVVKVNDLGHLKEVFFVFKYRLDCSVQTQVPLAARTLYVKQ